MQETNVKLIILLLIEYGVIIFYTKTYCNVKMLWKSLEKTKWDRASLLDPTMVKTLWIRPTVICAYVICGPMRVHPHYHIFVTWKGIWHYNYDHLLHLQRLLIVITEDHGFNYISFTSILKRYNEVVIWSICQWVQLYECGQYSLCK